MNMYCCLGRREMLKKRRANIPSNSSSTSLIHLMFSTKHRIYYGRNGNMVQKRTSPNYFCLKKRKITNPYSQFRQNISLFMKESDIIYV